MEYKLIRSKRKTVSVQITPEGVLVRAPMQTPLRVIDRFLNSKRGWIESRLAARPAPAPRFTGEELHELAKRAMEDLPQRLARFAPMLGVQYGRVTIRNQKTRWGSCSSKKNLNFNCLLMLCPEHIRDYVVVHELCHLREMNHSARFWALVAQILPDYQQSRKWLRTHGSALIQRL